MPMDYAPPAQCLLHPCHQVCCHPHSFPLLFRDCVTVWNNGPPLMYTGPLARDDFYQLLVEYMMAAAEVDMSAGWLFWNFDNELGDPRWSLFSAQDHGWFPANVSQAVYSPREPQCTKRDGLMIAGNFVSSLVLAMICWCLFLAGCTAYLMKMCCRCSSRGKGSDAS